MIRQNLVTAVLVFAVFLSAGNSNLLMAAGSFTPPTPVTVTVTLTGPVKSCTLTRLVSAFSFPTGVLSGVNTTYTLTSANMSTAVVRATCTPTVTAPNIRVTSSQTPKTVGKLGMGKSTGIINPAADNEDLALFLGAAPGNTTCSVLATQVASNVNILSAWATPTPGLPCDIAFLPTTNVIDYGTNSFDDVPSVATLTFTLNAT